jgi:hypothetical protein
VPRPGKPRRLVGSRLPLDYARETGASFLTAGALHAAKARTAVVEPRQSFDHQRLWADLLWSPTLAFNLFGDLAADLELGDRAVRCWWPDARGRVSNLRFVHSPGWLDHEYLNSLRAFDAVFELDLGDGGKGIVGLDVKYHEWAKPEIPKPTNLARYVQVAERSRAFASGATRPVAGRSALAVMWLEHLLLLSMLQHSSGAWRWGRYVVVHPAGNCDLAESCAEYRELLVDDSTFGSLTLDALLGSGALPASEAPLRERYIAGSSLAASRPDLSPARR